MAEAIVPVAIVGAGPYGLSLAAHLAAGGTGFRIFGTPMAFWSAIARAGNARYLKSFCFGTNVYVPEPGYGFSEWSTARGLEAFEPCSMEQFAEYGLWVQQRCVAGLEQQDVVAIRDDGGVFHLTLADGETLRAHRVVLATGLSRFDHLPERFAALPRELCTHSTHVAGFAAFAGKSVAVIGGGQSALEAAALLREAGAQPTLMVREPEIRWMRAVPRERSLWRRLRSPLSGLGSGPTAWFLTNVPGAVRRMPAGLRTRFVARHLPPEGAWWLRDRVDARVETLLATVVTDARATGNGCKLELLSDGRAVERSFDHIVAGTGFRVDVDRLDYLDQGLRQRIARIEGAPRLDVRFETTVPGLHVIGPASAMSFGPLFRFVVGADHSARTLARYFARSQ
jgi:cation diffusion facilitator CzcD-associated flavoprotein CzcO